jgi:hypothetical protein
MCYLFNFSFTNGEYPNLLKRAVVIPLHNKGDRQDLQNYRPLSLLSVFANVLVKLVKKRLMSHLNKHEYLSNKQYGFRTRRSAKDALEMFMTPTYRTINCYERTAGLFVDNKKAFNTLDHKILLGKLLQAGIRGIALDCLGAI